ncbi:MAG: NAD(P)H-hydrate epimerase [Planctomycetaceae bacterium]
MTELPAGTPARALTRDEVRQVDATALAEFGMPGVVLMENAGRGAAQLLLAQRPRGPVLVCAGKGNNGGDAFVLARYLDLAGVPVELLTCVPPEAQSADAAVFRHVVERAGLPSRAWPAPGWSTAAQKLPATGRVATVAEPPGLDFASFAWIVDGLLGTGARGAPGPELASLIDALHASGRPVFALDLPSGLDCDTGVAPGACVRATLTATFVAPKIGFGVPGADAWLGRVEIVDIGIPRALRERVLRP